MTIVRLGLTIPIALVAATLHALPWLSRRERLFGVTVTEEFLVRQGRALIRRYELLLLPWTLAALALSLLPRPMAHPGETVGLTLMPLAAATVIFWRIFNRIPRTVSAGRVRTAELASSDRAGRWLALLLLVPLASLAATAAYLHAHWGEIPARFPIHWNLQGVPNGWATKSLMGVYGPLMLGAAVVLLVAGITLLVRWAARRSAWNGAGMAVLLIVTLIMSCAFTMAGLVPLHDSPPSQLFEFTGAMLAAQVVAIALLVWHIRRSGTPPGEMTPDACWHGGMFYYNPQDPALMVEKRIGLGWTFNFAHSLAWFILAAMLLIPVAITILAAHMAAK